MPRSGFLNRPCVRGYALILCVTVPCWAQSSQWVNGSSGTIYYNSGNVGIGTANPIGKVEINAAGLYTYDFGTQLAIRDSTNTNKTLSVGYDGTNNIGYVKAVNSGVSYSPLVLNAQGGNVGIGTINPQSTLSVAGTMGVMNTSGNTNTAFVVKASGSETYNQVLSIQNAGGGNAAWFQGDGNLILNGGNTLRVNDTGSSNNVAIQSGVSGAILLNNFGGRVGIGTTNPQSTLAVGGTATVANTSGNTYPAFIVKASGSEAYNQVLSIQNAGGGNAAWFQSDGSLVLNGGNALRVNDIGSSNSMIVQSGVSGAVLLNSAGGNVGIGTTTPTHKLAVNGSIQAKEVIVNTGWADYVFRPEYRRAPLNEVAAYIEKYRHLPDLPSEKEVQQKGVGLGEMQAKLLAKIEELTLHMIEAGARISRLDEQNRDLREQNRESRERIARLEAALVIVK